LSLKRIVSGGQTGVDRGALDACLDRGFPCGGWCPAGRAAEDGPIPARYPVRELPGGDHLARTHRNVEDSDGTLIVYFHHPAGGTEKTLAHCINVQRPYQLVDAAEMDARRAAALTVRFLLEREVEVLNVAGPRGSEAADGHAYSRQLVTHLLHEIGAGQGHFPGRSGGEA
jgi:hypothetical protein